MTVQVKYEFEGLQMRYWLETEVNGRKVQSRGVLTSYTKHPTLQETRREAREKAEQATAEINRLIAEGLSLRNADAELRRIVSA